VWLLEGDLSRLTSAPDYKLHVSMGATKGFSLCRGGQEGGLQSVQGPQVFTDQAESVIPGHEVAYAVLTLPWAKMRMGWAKMRTYWGQGGAAAGRQQGTFVTHGYA